MTNIIHPVQAEMLRLEAAFEQDAPPPGPPVDECIAKLVDWRGDVSRELDPMLMQETKRAVRLAHGHYSEWVDITPLAVAMVAFLQGITFARAVRNVQDRGSG